MKKSLRRIAFFIWPPYEARYANNAARKEEKTLDELLQEIRAAMPANADYDDSRMLADKVQESEWNRKGALEEKALAFFSELAAPTQYHSCCAALFGGDWQQLKGGWAILAASAYSLGWSVPFYSGLLWRFS